MPLGWPTGNPWWPRGWPRTRPPRAAASPGRAAGAPAPPACPPGPLAPPAVASQERRPARAGEEAQILRVGLRGHGQLRLGGERAHLRLRQLAEREAQTGDRLRPQRAQHVGLILGGVGRGAQQAAGAAPRIVARGELARTEA